MNNITRLENLAIEIVDLIPASENLQAVLLCGSVASGLADGYSDVELKLIWKGRPSADERQQAFANINKEDLLEEYLEDGEFYRSFIYKSTKVDISHSDLGSLKANIDKAIRHFETSVWLQTLIAALLGSKTLRGDISDIRRHIGVYPQELSLACIRVNLVFESWSLRTALLARKDHLALHHLLDETMLQLFRLLFALNKVYLNSDSFKWLDYQLALIPIQPEHFRERVNSILTTAEQESSVAILQQLLLDVFDLIKQQQPDVDLTHAERHLRFVRAQPAGFAGSD